MAKTKYFIRITPSLEADLLQYMQDSNIQHVHVSNDRTNGAASVMYSAQLDTEEAMAIRLKYPLIGFLNFNKTFKNLRDIS